MSRPHVVYDPEWMIDAAGCGSFRVECECGWERSGFDTSSLARAAAFNHAAYGEGTPPAAGGEDPARRRRFWHRR